MPTIEGGFSTKRPEEAKRKLMEAGAFKLPFNAKNFEADGLSKQERKSLKQKNDKYLIPRNRV